VSAPGGKELNKDLLGLIQNNLVKVAGVEDGDGGGRGDSLGVGASLLVDELDDIISGTTSVITVEIKRQYKLVTTREQGRTRWAL